MTIDYANTSLVQTTWNGNPNISVNQTAQSPKNGFKSKRNLVVWAIRVAFSVGFGSFIAMTISFIVGDIWIGLFFIPAIIGAYGLFVSSGMQLNVIDAHYPYSVADITEQGYITYDVTTAPTRNSYLHLQPAA